MRVEPFLAQTTEIECVYVVIDALSFEKSKK